MSFLVAEPIDVKTVSKITESAEKLSINDGLSLIASSFLHDIKRKKTMKDNNMITLLYLKIIFI